MSVVSEFREFISRGSVIDLAVGVIIGGAFSKIVTSLVDHLITPPIGWLFGGIDFSDLKITLPVNPANPTGDAAIIQVIPATAPQDQATSDLVKHQRDRIVPPVESASGLDILVGGAPAGAIDFAS